MHSAIREHAAHRCNTRGICTPQYGNMLLADATPEAYAGGPELGKPTPGAHPQGLQMTTCMQGYNKP